MRKVVVYTLLSIDGVAEAPETFVLDFDEEMAANLAETIEAQDVVLLGRVMFDEWARYWPSSDDQPFADFINGVQKYVATSQPLSNSWTKAAAIERPVVDFVRDLKSGVGADIGVHGSITLARSLLTAGLVDELRLVVAPAVVGPGRRLFDSDTAGSRLKLMNSAGTPSDTLLLHYRVLSPS
ncbi:MAG: dihydrofolate reductase family protein [Nocardioidaceae bacterium]